MSNIIFLINYTATHRLPPDCSLYYRGYPFIIPHIYFFLYFNVRVKKKKTSVQYRFDTLRNLEGRTYSAGRALG